MIGMGGEGDDDRNGGKGQEGIRTVSQHSVEVHGDVSHIADNRHHTSQTWKMHNII